MRINGFIENSLNEWAGHIASVLFLPYCNLRCRYCHAAHLILHPERLESIPPAQIMNYLRRQQEWVDGVVITGGEPTLQGDALLGLIERIKEVGQDVMVETNGTLPDQLKRLIEGGYVDALSMDVKAPLSPQDYRRVTGTEVETDSVRHSIRLIQESEVPCEFRITVVPQLVGEDELERLAPTLEDAQRVALQNFKPDSCLDPRLRSVLPYLPERMDEFQQILAPYVGTCVVRGRERAIAARAAFEETDEA